MLSLAIDIFNRNIAFLSSKVPGFLHVMDIAGLVKGAAEGQGLGNNFLSHIGACDGIFHLCRKCAALFVAVRCHIVVKV